MKMVGAELNRLSHNNFFKGFLLILIILNVLLTYAYAIDKSHSKTTYTPESYRRFYSDYRKAPEEFNLKLENVTGFEPDYDTNDNFDKYKYTGNYLKESMLILEFRQRAAFVDSYNEFVADLIKKSSDTLTLTKGYDEYQVKSKAKYISAYEGLKGITLKADASRGVSGFVKNRICDIVIGAFIVLLTTVLFMNDREQGVLILIKTGYHGRKELILEKVAVICVLTTLFTAVSYGISLFIFGMLYGLGDVSRSIISVEGFEYCVFNISVLKYIAVFFMLKAIGWVSVAAVVFLMAVISKNSLFFYGLQIFYWLSGVLLSGNLSKKSLFGNINPISVIRVQEAFYAPVYIDICGIPADFFTVYVLACTITFAVAVYLCIDIFVSQQEARLCTGRRSLFDIKGRSCRIISSVFHENYKFYINSGALTVLLVYIVFTALTYKSIDKQFFTAQGSDQNYIDAYIDVLSGKITEEKLDRLEDERVRLEELESKYNSLLAGKGTDPHVLALYEEELQKKKSFDYIYYTMTPALIERGGAFVHQTGYGFLTGYGEAHYKDLELAMMWCLAVMFPLCSLFGRDYQLNMYGLLSCTKKGKKRIILEKLIIALFFALVIYLVTYVPYYYSVISKYGTSGIGENISSLLYLKTGSISIFWYLVILNLVRYVLCVLCILVIAWISKRNRNVLHTLIAMISFTVIPLMFAWMI